NSRPVPIAKSDVWTENRLEECRNTSTQPCFRYSNTTHGPDTKAQQDRASPRHRNKESRKMVNEVPGLRPRVGRCGWGCARTKPFILPRGSARHRSSVHQPIHAGIENRLLSSLTRKLKVTESQVATSWNLECSLFSTAIALWTQKA